MRPVYMHISYMAVTDNNDKKEFTYGSTLWKCIRPTTADEIRKFIADKFGIDVNAVQIMSISVLPKRVYKMLKGIQ